MEIIKGIPVKSEKVARYEDLRLQLGNVVGKLNTSTSLSFSSYVQNIDDVNAIKKFLDVKDALIMQASVLNDEIEELVKDGAFQESMLYQINVAKYNDFMRSLEA